MADLKTAVLNTWDELSDYLLQMLIDSMPSWVFEVISFWEVPHIILKLICE